MEDFKIRRRNRLKHHYTLTSNVLLFGYKHMSDSAKLTYQVIDSFDWQDGAGLRKGYAYPSLGTLAEIRGVDERTIRRHLVQLEGANLITRNERAGRPSLMCHGIVTPRQLRFESSSYEEQRRQISLGYSDDLLIEQPAVMDLNMRAASYGMMYLRHLLQPFLLPPLPGNLTESLVNYAIRPIHEARVLSPTCRTCQVNAFAGYGDCAEPLGYASDFVVAISAPPEPAISQTPG